MKVGQVVSLHQQGYPSKEINQIGLAVDKAIVNANKQKKRRDYLGGSSLGFVSFASCDS